MNWRPDHLEEQGFDVTEIRNALENAGHETAKALVQEFGEVMTPKAMPRLSPGASGQIRNCE